MLSIADYFFFLYIMHTIKSNQSSVQMTTQSVLLLPSLQPNLNTQYGPRIIQSFFILRSYYTEMKMCYPYLTHTILFKYLWSNITDFSQSLQLTLITFRLKKKKKKQTNMMLENLEHESE